MASDRDTLAEQKYGYCPACKRRIRLKKDGTVRHHGGQVPSGAYYRPYSCKGVGQLPSDEAGAE